MLFINGAGLTFFAHQPLWLVVFQSYLATQHFHWPQFGSHNLAAGILGYCHFKTWRTDPLCFINLGPYSQRIL